MSTCHGCKREWILHWFESKRSKTQLQTKIFCDNTEIRVMWQKIELVPVYLILFLSIAAYNYIHIYYQYIKFHLLVLTSLKLLKDCFQTVTNIEQYVVFFLFDGRSGPNTTRVLASLEALIKAFSLLRLYTYIVIDCVVRYVMLHEFSEGFHPLFC